MASYYLLTQKNVEGIIGKVIKEKISFWNERYPNLKFDEKGHAVIGKLPIDINDQWKTWIDENGNQNSQCVHWLKDILLQRGAVRMERAGGTLESVGWFDYVYEIPYEFFVNNKLVYYDEKENKIEIKMSKLLKEVQVKYFEKFPKYKETLDEIRELRKQGVIWTDPKMKYLDDIKKQYTRQDLFYVHDQFLNVVAKKEEKMILSINPLDLLTSSGNRQGENPTKFGSCWSVGMHYVTRNNKSYWKAIGYGEYAVARNIVEMGKLVNRALLYVENGSTLVTDHYVFSGYKERSHVWWDTDGLWIEKIYPSKDVVRKNAWIKLLKDEGLEVIDPNDLDKVEEFDFQPNLEFFDDETRIFLDRTAIEEGVLYRLYDDRCNMSWQDGITLNGLNKARVYCDHCEQYVDYDESDMQYVENVGHVCPRCLNSHYTWCDECQSYHPDSEMREVINSRGHSIQVCDSCLDSESYQYCDECGRYIHEDRMMSEVAHDEYGNEIHICRHCYENGDYFICDDCGEIYKYDYENTIKDGDKYVCNDCYDGCYETCGDCGRNFPIEDMKCIDGTWYCDGCVDTHRLEEDEEVAMEDARDEVVASVVQNEVEYIEMYFADTNNLLVLERNVQTLEIEPPKGDEDAPF